MEKVIVAVEDHSLDDEDRQGVKKEQAPSSVKEHVKGHKYKYAVLVSSAIIVAVCCALLIAYIRSRMAAANALVSGKIGTTIPAVSAIPAKPLPTSSRRRLLQSSGNGAIESTFQRFLSNTAKDPSTYDSSSDYTTFGESSLTVGDVSLDSVNTINMIACLTKQMRAIDIGLNKTYNPTLMPYTAIVDPGLCGISGSGIMTWAIKSSGPSEFGDGTYKSTASFSGFGTLMHIEFTNIVFQGALKKSSVAWSSAGQPGKGITVIDYSDPTLSDVLLASSDGNYLHAIFNPTTFVGSVVSANSNSPDKTYALDFNTNAINRRTTTTGGGSASSVCLDFSADKMLISGDQYTLFNAADGSKKRQVMGYPITATVAGTTVSLYAGYWGLDAPAVMSDDGKSIRYTPDQVKAAITDGLSVSVQQGDGSVASRTLKFVNGQLQVTSIETTTLGAIKGLPLTIADGSGLQISWTGTKFVKEGKSSYRCFWGEGDKLTPVTTTATLNSESEAQQHCLCLDPNGSNPYQVKASGSCKNPSAHNDPGFDYGQFPESLPGSEEYVPQSSYDGTIQVRNQQFNGRINLNVDALQQLSGVVNQHYTAGTVIKQNITGAVGIIYEDTPIGILGLTGTTVSFTATLAGNVVTVTNVTAGKVLLNWGFNVGGNYYTVASQVTSTETNSAPNGKGTYSLSFWSATQTFTAQTITGSYITTYHQSGDRWQNYLHFCDFPSALSGDGSLNPGTTLTQGSVTATVAGGWGGWGPLPVTMTTAGTKFDLTSTTPITVSAASMNGRWDITGVLNFDKAAGVDDSWSNGNPITIISSGSCTASSFSGSLELGGSTGDYNITGVDGGSFGSTKPAISLYNYGQIWGYVSAPGTSCLQTDLDGIKITFACGAIIAVKCKTRFDSSSNTIRVKLSGSTKFESGKEKPIIMVSDPTKILTDPWFKGLWWVQDVIGNIKPSTDSTTVSYSFYSIAQPGDTIPAELWCYDNCPIGDDSSSTSSVSTLGKYDSIKTVTEVSINNQGTCDVDAKNSSTVGFSGYTNNPTVQLGWTANTDSSGTGTYYTLTSVTITDPGSLDLSSSPAWTLSYAAGICSTAPTFNSINANHGDYKDYRSVYKYSYDPLTGLLTDKQNNNQTLITDPSADSDSSFGPFFAGTSENKAALLCPWNSNLVCSWQVWQKLSQTYNWRTGPNSIRVSLLDGSNKPMPFDAPTSMLYQVPQGTKSNSGTTYDGVNLFMTYYNCSIPAQENTPIIAASPINVPPHVGTGPMLFVQVDSDEGAAGRWTPGLWVV